ncbi:SipW-dependent-type signal peptide-containing protein [Paenarthrobacter sp. AR 02]|uniref:SipW-dependent-type signal peptide-containing protein n=1 Tax=Paenarthrobacter sp. AR 02 TaxID=2899821 RepID=UPI001F3031D2|nr:SipW-dependent-type signal peptide-containing protein [Paenarthrobacter sp. AR 02]MCF3140745.1 SipW-dependent-type signal peptide-containing protein [Paenarthrobacter sp. AR 02]
MLIPVDADIDLGGTMFAQETTTAEASQRLRKAPKIRAILAGGLVLGVGAAITLAAWNDSEFAQGTFTAGAFNLEGSTDGSDFGENPVTAPATLGFTANTANMAPGDVVTAPFAVRLDSTTTSDATVTVSTETSTGGLVGLTYALTQSTAFGCGQAVTATLVPAGQSLGTTPGSVTFALTQGAGTDPGAPVNLCFRITADQDLVQSQTGSTTWEFAAQSQ